MIPPVVQLKVRQFMKFTVWCAKPFETAFLAQFTNLLPDQILTVPVAFAVHDRHDIKGQSVVVGLFTGFGVGDDSAR